MDQQRENDILVTNFFERSFFRNWKTKDNMNLDKLELMINATCDLACKYCYYQRHGSQLYPPEIAKPDQILAHLNMVYDWLFEKGYKPELDFFTGEMFAQKVARDALDLTHARLAAVPPEKRMSNVIIPTNYSFLLDEKRLHYVEDKFKQFADIDVVMSLSTSVDGKYMEQNRPMRAIMHSGKPDPRDDGYYAELFKFNKHYNAGFHPMVYSEGIEDWPKNFMWFQEMFAKYDIPWYRIYLLEVRNVEWTHQQIADFGKFIEFLIRYAWERCGKNYEEYKDFLFKKSGFNMLASPLTIIGRGLGCSIQGTFMLRLGDLMVVPCHRTMYPGHETAQLKVHDGKIVGVTAKNPELMTAVYSSVVKHAPYCEGCILNNMCSLGCLGSQYETTGDMFAPIPTVCELEHVKVMAMIKTYEDLGILHRLINEIDPGKKETILLLKKLYSEGK